MSPPRSEKPNDDPALAMTVLWNRDRDQYEKTLRLAAERESDLFKASPAKRNEAQRLYDAAYKSANHLGDQLERLTRAIFRSKAQTVEGAAAKLAVAIRDCAPGPRSEEAPWPYLRNIQADLERLAAATANDRQKTQADLPQ